MTDSDSTNPASSAPLRFRNLQERLAPLHTADDASELDQMASMIERVLDQVEELKIENGRLRAELDRLAPAQVAIVRPTSERPEWRIQGSTESRPMRSDRPIPVKEVIGETGRWVRQPR